MCRRFALRSSRRGRGRGVRPTRSPFVGLQTDRPFGLAGLWERWEKGGEPVESCTILTTDANELMQPVHERMPAFLPPDQYGLWLDTRCQDSEKLAKLLRPWPSKAMLAYRVGTLVNIPKNDVPQCVEAIRRLTWAAGRESSASRRRRRHGRSAS